MKYLKFSIAFAALLTAFSFSCEAQNYKLAAGARLGYPLSASIKYFITDSGALEGYVGTRGYATYRWANVSGAFLLHYDFEGVDGLQYYFGAGASIYFWNYKNNFGLGEQPSSTIGLQGYAGLDYTFNGLPLNLTIDWVPTIFLSGFDSGFGGGYGSLGVRYILVE